MNSWYGENSAYSQIIADVKAAALTVSGTALAESHELRAEPAAKQFSNADALYTSP